MYSQAYCHEDICGLSSAVPHGQQKLHPEGTTRDLQHVGMPANDQLEQRQHQGQQLRGSYQSNQDVSEQHQHQHRQQVKQQHLLQPQQLYAPWNKTLPQPLGLPTQCDLTSADTGATLLQGASVPPSAAPCCSGTGSFAPHLNSELLVPEASGSVGSCCRAQGVASGAGDLGGEDEEPGECAISRSGLVDSEDMRGAKEEELRNLEGGLSRGQHQGQHLQQVAMHNTPSDWIVVPQNVKDSKYPATVVGYAVPPFFCRDGAASMIPFLGLPVYLPPVPSPPGVAAAPPMGMQASIMLPSVGLVSPFPCTNTPWDASVFQPSFRK
ncbi:unnamed protein product [Closterium sp. NIES-54]